MRSKVERTGAVVFVFKYGFSVELEHDPAGLVPFGESLPFVEIGMRAALGKQ